jgi:hypothetical protein
MRRFIALFCDLHRIKRNPSEWLVMNRSYLAGFDRPMTEKQTYTLIGVTEPQVQISVFEASSELPDIHPNARSSDSNLPLLLRIVLVIAL